MHCLEILETAGLSLEKIEERLILHALQLDTLQRSHKIWGDHSFFFQISTYRITDYHPKCFDVQICLLLPKDCEILRTQNIQHLSINAHSSEPQRLTFSAFFLMEEQIHGHRSCQHHSILRFSIHQVFPVNIHHLEHQQQWELICAELWIQWFLAHNPLGVGGLILHLQVPGDTQPKRSRDANILCFLIHR